MKPAIILVLFYVFANSSGFTQSTKRNLLKRFDQATVVKSLIPREQWRPFPKTPDEWKAKFPDSILTRFLTAGETALKEEFKSIPATVALEFVRTGNRRNYQNLANKKRQLVWDLALAESIEGKGRFSDHLLNGLWSICEESFWGATAHLFLQGSGKGLPDASDPVIDLFAAETASTLAWIDYFTGNTLDKVSPLIRKRIRFETEKRIFNPMDTAKYFYLGRGNEDEKLNNWTPWIMSNYIITNLLLREDESKRASSLVFAMKYMDQYINGLGEDGGCDEGPGYWFGASGTLFDGLNLINHATAGQVNIFKEPFLQKMASYIYKTHIADDYFINVADAAPTMRPAGGGVMLYRFGKAIGDPQLMSFGSWVHDHIANNGPSPTTYNRSRFLFNLFAIEECDNYTSNFKDVDDAWFSDVQLMASRSANGFFLSSHAGHNDESHNHNDVGDFMVYFNGHPMIVDVGPGAYTARTFSEHRYSLWFNTSAYHNLPTVNGYQQADGLEFTATNVRYHSDKSSSTLQMDIAKAYPAQAGIKSWVRKARLNKKGSVDISDEFKLDAPSKTLTQSFMTVCETDVSTPGKIVFVFPDGQKAFLDYDAKAWNAKKEKIPLVTEEDQRFKLMWPGKEVSRILLSSKKNNKEGRFVYKIYSGR